MRSEHGLSMEQRYELLNVYLSDQFNIFTAVLYYYEYAFVGKFVAM